MNDPYKTILMIEDELFIADLYADVLRNHGFEVTCAYDGVSGLELAQQKAYDLILLDIMLPALSGPEVLSRLRDPAASPGFVQTTPIFIMTNFDEDDITKKNLLALAQAWLVKVNITPLTLATMLKNTPKGTAPQLG